jgi:hypothetical protein
MNFRYSTNPRLKQEERVPTKEEQEESRARLCISKEFRATPIKIQLDWASLLKKRRCPEGVVYLKWKCEFYQQTFGRLRCWPSDGELTSVHPLFCECNNSFSCQHKDYAILKRKGISEKTELWDKKYGIPIAIWGGVFPIKYHDPKVGFVVPFKIPENQD